MIEEEGCVYILGPTSEEIAQVFQWDVSDKDDMTDAEARAQAKSNAEFLPNVRTDIPRLVRALEVAVEAMRNASVCAAHGDPAVADSYLREGLQRIEAALAGEGE